MEQQPIFFAGYAFSPVNTTEDLSLAVAKLLIQIQTKETEAGGFSHGSEAHRELMREAMVLKIILESLQHEFLKKGLRSRQRQCDSKSSEWSTIEQRIFEADRIHVITIQRILAGSNGSCCISEMLKAAPELIAGYGVQATEDSVG